MAYSITRTIPELGLITPGNSQEQVDFDNDTECLDEVMAFASTTITVGASSSFDNVEWPDTDVSEDDDYLPQQCHRHIASPPRRYLPADNKDDMLIQERKCTRVELPLERRMNVDLPAVDERVRRAIDSAVDNGEDYVDLSYLSLVDIPDEIAELQYVTVLRKDMIKSTSLKLFLYGNALSRLSPCLFVLKNLSVLSLRHNQLRELPPEIGLLQNLVEVSVGNNQLEYLPSELVELPRLTTLCVSPNPFCRPQSPEGIRHVIASIPSLVEITTRQLLTKTQALDDSVFHYMPYDLQDRLRSVSPMNVCHTCQQRFYSPSAQEMVWSEVFGVHNVPLLYRFCSRRCCDARN